MCPCELIIVDDDDDVRFAVHTLAQESLPQAHITDYTLSRDALAQIHRGHVDLLITNCHMPDMDGPTLVRRLRADHFSLPIIMVSGSADACAMGTEAGIDRFVDKQHLAGLLPDAIHGLLDK